MAINGLTKGKTFVILIGMENATLNLDRARLTSNKTLKKGFKFNPDLWELFDKTCEEIGLTPTKVFEEAMISILKQQGKLPKDL